MPPLADYQYYRFRNIQQQVIDFQELVGSCDIENYINQMPAKLRK